MVNVRSGGSADATSSLARLSSLWVGMMLDAGFWINARKVWVAGFLFSIRHPASVENGLVLSPNGSSWSSSGTPLNQKLETTAFHDSPQFEARYLQIRPVRLIAQKTATYNSMRFYKDDSQSELAPRLCGYPSLP